MNTDSPERETTVLEEAIISNMWEIAAIVEVLERKGLAAHPYRGPAAFYRCPSIVLPSAQAQVEEAK